MATAEAIKSRQKRYNDNFAKKAKNPRTKSEAVAIARKRLISAGILDKDGKVAEHYR